MNGRYLLDSNVLIDFLDGNESAVGLRNAAAASLYASVITRMELLSAVRNTEERVSTIYNLLSFFTIVPLNYKVEAKAIEIRRETGLKLPDAIIAASSIVTESILITHDRHLKDAKWHELRAQENIDAL
ncbi:MAG: PIN domain-containing protein [Synergistaceae bacterium]|jgi:predicted nucleic acid-binding protein|nr:PIN domain-containing protein [Synergistaceae bacterium]